MAADMRPRRRFATSIMRDAHGPYASFTIFHADSKPMLGISRANVF